MANDCSATMQKLIESHLGENALKPFTQQDLGTLVNQKGEINPHTRQNCLDSVTENQNLTETQRSLLNQEILQIALESGDSGSANLPGGNRGGNIGGDGGLTYLPGDSSGGNRGGNGGLTNNCSNTTLNSSSRICDLIDKMIKENEIACNQRIERLNAENNACKKRVEAVDAERAKLCDHLDKIVGVAMPNGYHPCISEAKASFASDPTEHEVDTPHDGTTFLVA